MPASISSPLPSTARTLDFTPRVTSKAPALGMRWTRVTGREGQTRLACRWAPAAA